jgi:predicted DNA binding CopG/RHH family protein
MPIDNKQRIMKPNHLIQTRISKMLFAWIKQNAADEGITVAAWLRRNLKMQYREREGISDE